MNAETIYAAFAAWIETVRFNGAAFGTVKLRSRARIRPLDNEA